LSVAGILDDLWISPQEHPDFAWAFGGRTLVNLANSFGTSFLIFFLTKDLHRPDPTSDLLVLTLVYLVFTLIATAVSSIISDRTGRRRIFVAGAAAFQATAGILIGLFPGYAVGILGAALLGAGYGAYMAVDQALVTEVLPDATSKAKDLGIMNIGSVVPQALGPVIGTLIISELGGYSALYLATGVVSALGAGMVYKVRSVR
jgi:MFS family permease